MFKENRKLVDSWTFDWLNQRTGQQLIRMKFYECSGLLATSKYVIEFENKCGLVFHSENYASVSDSLLMYLEKMKAFALTELRKQTLK